MITQETTAGLGNIHTLVDVLLSKIIPLGRNAIN
jgi:hypothetical protein